MKKKTPAFLKSFPGGTSPWPVCITLCLAVLVSYASVWSNEFLFNDGILIAANEYLKHWSSLPQLLSHLSNAGYGLPGGFYRPVEMLIYFLIYQAFGPSTIAYHTLNISLQALNACLLHRFGILAGFRKGAVFAAALLWAVHPLHTSNVAYMSSTAELLWGCFGLLGLITLLPDFAQRRSGAKQIPGAFAPQKIWKAMIFFILALGCKESAVVFPALAAVTFFFVSKDRTQVVAYVKLWPLWLLAGCYIAAWLLFMHTSGPNLVDMSIDPAYKSSFIVRTLTSLATLPIYARLILWPTGLHIEWFLPVYSTLLAWQPAAGALLAGLGLLQIVLMRVRQGKEKEKGLALSFGILWFALALSPYTGIVIPVDAFLAEGWMYVPLMGLFLGVAQTVAGFFDKRQNAARTLVLFTAFSLGITIFFQGQVWRTPETLYLNNVQNQKWDPGERSYLLGLFYLMQQDFDKSIEQFHDLINHPEGSTDDKLASAHMWLAMALLHVDVKGDNITLEALNTALPHSEHTFEAISELGNALEKNPDFYQVHKILAVIYRFQGVDRMADFHEKKAKDILQKQGNATGP